MKKKLFYFACLFSILMAVFMIDKGFFTLFSEKKDQQSQLVKVDIQGQTNSVSNKSTLEHRELYSEITEKKVNENEQQYLEKKLDRLIELDESIDANHKDFHALIDHYDNNLDDDGIRSKLSSTLLHNNEYRTSMIEKFKIERELEK